MGIAEDLEAAFRSHYAATMGDWQQWWGSNTKHGCFCGAGSLCDQAIDALDSCCAQHDEGYSSVGQSADTMWSVEGLIACRHADRALATCAASAQTVADNEHSNPDPEAYRSHLIALFSYRADVGDALATLYERLRQVEGALHGFTRWLSASAEPLSTGDSAAVGEAQQHVAYLQSLDATPEQIDSHLNEQGFDPATIRGQAGIA
jgi:hypothetical protein